MKINKTVKIVLIVILLVGIVLIGSGIIFGTTSRKSGNDQKNVDYKKVNDPQPNQFTEVSLEKFDKVSKEIGFDEAGCIMADGSEDTFQCDATKKSYNNSDNLDQVTITYKDQKIVSSTISIYYSEKDYKIDEVSKKFIDLSKNYFGTDLTQSNLKSLDTELQEYLKSGKDTIASTERTINNYYSQISIQKVEDEDFYIVRLFVVDSSLL